MKFLTCPKCKLSTRTTKFKKLILCSKCGFKGEPEFIDTKEILK